MKLWNPFFFFCAIVMVARLCVGYDDNSTTKLCFTTLFQFGASLFDTGNAVIAFPRQAFQPTRPPYGSTFPGRPAKRFSDGKLIVDYLADAFKIQLLHPYLESVEPVDESRGGENRRSSNYTNGVCFSVAMATALSLEELRLSGIGRRNITLNPLTSDVQYGWFQSVRSRMLRSRENRQGRTTFVLPDRKAIEDGLYLPGEFGVNDYRVGLLSGLSAARMKKRVPFVVHKIVNLIKKLHMLGARNFLVMGVPPQGCSPFYLTLLNGTRDKFNCLAEVNEIHRLHESNLKIALRDLRGKLEDSNIMFADYYRAFMSVMKHPAKYDIRVTNIACCGGGGTYNYDPSAVCGTTSSRTCSNPSNHIYWDDFHTTDAFNQIMATKFTSGEFLEPPIISLGCP